MTVRRNRQPLLLLLSMAVTCVLLVAAVTGCGGDEPATTTSTPSETTATTAAPETTTTAASTTTTGPTTTTTVAASTTTSTTETCSASDLDLGLFPELGLPAPVEDKRRLIFEAAISCDFDGLESLASADGGIRFSFGDEQGGPAAYWRAAEQRGDPVLATLLKVLNMPYGRAEGQYVWPFAHALDFSRLTDEQTELLRQYFTEDEIQDWVDFGGYIGYRVGITPEGEWLYYIAGD